MNLIITCPRHFESDAIEEIGNILDELGDDSPDIKKSDLSGILFIQTKIDPIETCHKIRDIVHDEPWAIRYIQRAIPIQQWIETDTVNIIAKSCKMASAIQENEKYRVTIEKRNSSVSSQEIIAKIADAVNKDVSLDNPDRIILVEIFGSHTGLAIIRDGDIISIEREKRASSE